jgi:predicted small lipoprotein YifL
MNKTSRCLFLIPAALLLLALSACGNKGPLVMPQKPVPIEEQEVTPADADDAASDAQADQAEPQPVDSSDDAEIKPAKSADKPDE